MKTKRIAKAIKLTKANFLSLMTDFKKSISATGVTFGSVVYFVEESGSRLVDKKKVLQKFVRTNITIGAKYGNRINKDLVKQGEEGNFVPQGMSGKEYVNDEGVIAIDIKTRTKHYLVATVEHRTKPDTVYFHNGKRISKAEAIEKNLFMPSYFAEKTTSGRGNMSEENDFHTITPNIENIISLTMNGVKYVIED